ncbi:ead/Ea22-like family protein [Enterobacter sp.]|uniref:ead/Ea22-like family protein n=1 Tax=Enterobacter sp. TaxID=42895 RepID=UPI00296F568C|nr:ead/Ea22-like family protein [Enterobacter sp.]
MADTNELTAKLKAAAQDEIMCREACDTSDAWHDAASPENVLALTDALEAAEKRSAELEARTLTVKLPPYSFFDFKLGSNHTSGAYVNLEAMNKELAKAGIKLQIEGE